MAHLQQMSHMDTRATERIISTKRMAEMQHFGHIGIGLPHALRQTKNG
ncbi:MAG: hypothetical protein WC659_01030 [Patescibacteria group bacterium]